MTTRATLIRAAALGAAGVVTAGGTFLSLQANAEAAAPAAKVTQAATPSAEEGLPPATDLVQHVQRAGTVTVYRGGRKVATVTPVSAAHAHGRGELVLEIAAVKKISFPAGQFIWEDPGGADHRPVHPKQRVEVAAGVTTTATIRYDGVGDGDIIWATSADEVVGAWAVEGAAVSGRPADIPPQYLQRGSTVTVFEGGRAVADVTATSATHPGGAGRLAVKVSAVRTLDVYPDSFIWEDEDGGDHEAVGGPEKVTVKAGATRTLRIAYRGVGAGDAIWVPAQNLVAGSWAID